MEILNVASVILAGLMVGSELAVAMFVHPTLDRLPDNVHLPAASALARLMGKAMPIWYGLVFFLTLIAGLVYWHQSGRLSMWIAASAILWLLAILCSVTLLVPINKRIASWEKDSPPADWKTFRSRWDLLHRWRVALLAIAFAFLVVGIMNE